MDVVPRNRISEHFQKLVRAEYEVSERPPAWLPFTAGILVGALLAMALATKERDHGRRASHQGCASCR